ncbi:hypothetical protein ANN_09418 [Periplaneta americana]|uniref:Uncharacterized protein n=1 Tax=Periplaneta americana TaxID=6978 RepID=A0ABQ8TMR9_PERAM|nr:hypothetical protein ANN_09418 [Periplaneta americana]
MAGLSEGGNEPPGSLKANRACGGPPKLLTFSAGLRGYVNLWLFAASSGHSPPDGRGGLHHGPFEGRNVGGCWCGMLHGFGRMVVVITEDIQNVHLLLEYRPHIDVSLTCEHDPKLQEYCVCRNREGSDQVSVEAKQLGHLYLTIDQETFDASSGEPYD